MTRIALIVAAALMLTCSACESVTYLDVVCISNWPGADDWVSDPPGNEHYCERAYGPWEEYDG